MVAEPNALGAKTDQGSDFATPCISCTGSEIAESATSPLARCNDRPERLDRISGIVGYILSTSDSRWE